MKGRIVFAALWLAILSSVGTMPSTQELRDVERNDPLRSVLLDALRPTIAHDIGSPVQFVVKYLRVQGKWAFFAGEPQHMDGTPIDFTQTHYADGIDAGMFDGPFLQALLENQDGSWMVRVFDIGATDVIASGWPGDFGAPCSVVGYDFDPC